MSQILLAFPSKHCHLRKHVLYRQLGTTMTGLAMEILMCVGLIEDSTSIIECFPPVANEKMVSFLINAGHLIQSGLRL